MMTVRMHGNQWARRLAYVTGLVNQELLLQNEYLAAESPSAPASTATPVESGAMHIC